MFRLKNLIIVLFALVIASPAYAQADAKTVSLGKTDQFGNILVGKDGMTLYIYTPDTANTSTCYDKCAEAWPPLLVDSADKLSVADGIPGAFATFARKDGKLQVSYNGRPLYYWFKDAKAGDVTGNRVGRVWWVVPPATVSSIYEEKVGTVLVDPKGMTLYKYNKDTENTSNCYDKCATNWPPLTVKSEADLVPGLNLLGKFGTTKRTDGTLQVTYNGAPLYTYVKDAALGDAVGEGVGNVWYTIAPEAVGTNKDGALVSYDGMTLYTFSKDTPGVSTCTGDCAKQWPAYTVDKDDKAAAATGISGKLESIKHDDDTVQLTYNGSPLYFFKDDKAPGDAKGAAVAGWAVAKP